MPRYWVCERCGTYNLDDICDTCGLNKEQGMQYEEIRESDPLIDDEYEDQEDWLLTSIFEEEESDWESEEWDEDW